MSHFLRLREKKSLNFSGHKRQEYNVLSLRHTHFLLTSLTVEENLDSSPILLFTVLLHFALAFL